MRRFAAALLFAAALTAAEPVRVILDTDLGPDCDDAGALAILHAMSKHGEATVLGVMCNTTSEWCAPAADAIDTWYHRGDIPIGTLKGPGNPGGGPQWEGGTYNRYLAEHWPNRIRSGKNAEDATALYRRILAAAPDHSVAVVSVGNTTNLRNLLVSEGGVELVRKKVRVLSVMGGAYPRGTKPDPNLSGDLPASQTVLAQWPTPIMFSGIEIGDRIKTAAALYDRTPESDPVRMAYLRWDGYFWKRWDKTYDGHSIRPHPSYDQTAVLYAVRGLRDYWTARTNGTNTLTAEGVTEWRPAPDHQHSYLIESMPPDKLAEVIQNLMLEPPAAPGGSRLDLYPEVHPVLRELEAAEKAVPVHEGASHGLSAAKLYARAGYLDDAARAVGSTTEPYFWYWRARVLYGDLPGAEKSLQSIVEPEKKAQALASLGDFLWRMGEPVKAQARLVYAQKVALQITNVEHRKRVLASIAQSLQYLPIDPPSRFSPVPRPQTKPNYSDSPFPLFPITPGGFHGTESLATADRNRRFLQDLYSRIAARDREALQDAVDAAPTPFQKALALASIEHLLLQLREPELAEQYANKIPPADPDCLLAKAEALTAAGAAWFRADNSGRAQADFQSALEIAKGVTALPMGQVTVVLAIAQAQADAGMMASSHESLSLAMRLAAQPWAYEKILPAAIRCRDFGVAYQIAILWSGTGEKAHMAIVRAWLNAGRPEEAIAYARGIAEPQHKVTALYVLADEMLSRAGAPVF